MAEDQTAPAADRFDSGDIVARLKLRMIEQALPLWSTEGWDATTGGFVDRLGPDGRADRLDPFVTRCRKVKTGRDASIGSV